MIPRLLAITPGWSGDGHEGVWLLEAMARAGLGAVVLREPALDQRRYVALARALAPCFGPGLLLHGKHPDALELAVRGGFGLHLPAGADLVAARRRVRGLLGASCHDGAGLAAAADAGCDYATISPVFRPGSKPDDARPTLGLDGLARLCRHARLPVLALGGVGPGAARAVLAAGASGVATIGGLFGPDATPEGAEEAVAGWLAALG